MSKTDPRAKLQSEIRRAERKLEKLKERARKARAALDFAAEHESTEKALILQSEIEALRAERDALLEALTEIVAAADGDGWKQLDPTFTTARAAIAKATRGTSHRKSE